MKHSIRILLTTLLLAVAASCCTAANKPFPSILKYTHEKKATWLFVLGAKDGTIKQVDKKTYTLNMRLPAIDQVTEFTSRPYRSVKYTDLAAFKRLWVAGDNDFTKDPPNAVLSASNLKPEVILIKHITLQGEDRISVHFQPLSLKNQPLLKHMQHITLVVDTCILDYGDCGQNLSSTSKACEACKEYNCNNYKPGYSSKEACLEDTAACAEYCQ